MRERYIIVRADAGKWIILELTFFYCVSSRLASAHPHTYIPADMRGCAREDGHGFFSLSPLVSLPSFSPSRLSADDLLGGMRLKVLMAECLNAECVNLITPVSRKSADATLWRTADPCNYFTGQETVGINYDDANIFNVYPENFCKPC